MRYALPLLACLLATASAGGDSPSAFLFARDPGVKHSIRLGELVKGVRSADPRDGIPTIRRPEAMAAREASWLKGADRVLGVVVGEQARAYPLDVLEGHELVNDTLGGRPIAPNY